MISAALSVTDHVYTNLDHHLMMFNNHTMMPGKTLLVGGGVAEFLTLQTLLVGGGCSRVCHITNSASGGGV